MRIIALAFGFLLAFQTTMLAQAGTPTGARQDNYRPRSGGVRGGFQVAPTWSWLRTEDKLIEGVGTNWGVKFGAELEFPNLKKTEGGLAFVTGIGLGLNQGGTLLTNHSQGSYWPETDLSTPLLDTLPLGSRLTYHLTYLEIPLGGRLRFDPIGRLGDLDIRPNIDGGLVLGFRTRAIGDIRGTAPVQAEDEVIIKETAPLSLSWQLIFSVEFERPNGGSMVVGIGYQQQFTDMTSDNGTVIDPKTNAWRKEDSRGTFSMLSLRLAYYL
ncbi:MAG: hypothetical protein ACKVU2_04035 [Saprospiraceae bacterium]